MDDGFARSERRHRAFVAVVIAAVAVAITFVAVSVATRAPIESAIFSGAGMLEFTIVGALILDRRPGQPVGRICLTIGLLLMASTLLDVGALVLTQTGPFLRAGEAMKALAPYGGNSALILAGPVLISRFPNGSTPGWARRVQDLVIVMSWAALISGENLVGLVVASLLAGAGIVLRYRRGGQVERAQIRWFGAAVGTTLALGVALIVTSGNDGLNALAFTLWILSFLLPPIAIGIAILRYRLYDIDRIISNTIGYGLVSVVLVGVFIVVNLGLQGALLISITGSNPVAVAASTLLVAVSFNPLRRRIQRVVDRRFHRAVYDAERTVAGLAGQLRDEVDIARLRQEILKVVDRSFEPTDVHLWLRTGSAR